MSLVGNLEDLPLSDILQIVSLSRKSGVLGLTRNGVEAKVYFQSGLVVSASVSDFPLDLGAFLVRKKLLQSADLAQVRERVRQGADLSSLLQNEYHIPANVIEGFSKAGIEKVVYRLFTWKEGAFHFDLTEPGALERQRDPFAPYYAGGINPQFLAMEGARLKDESDYFSTQTSSTPKPAPSPSSPVQPAASPPVETLPRAAAAELPQGLILTVVDNDVVALKNIEAALKRAGFEVAAFHRVDAILKAVRELLRKGRPVVALVDLVMPKRDASGMLGGLEVLELLRAEDQHVPVILMADLNNPEAQQRAGELGVDGYLDKPGRKYYVKEPTNPFPEFAQFTVKLLAEVRRVASKAAAITASRVADPFFDLGRELHGELEAATVALSATVPAGLAPAEKTSRGLLLLKEMVRELNDPHFNADVSLLVLRFATELMNRAVIFAVGHREVIGLGQAGIDLPDATQIVRRMRIPLGEPSIFKDVDSQRMAIRRKLDSSRYNRMLIEMLGGFEPVESFAAPIFTSKRMAAILYADNAPEPKPIGDVEALEIFLSHAGIAMERALLERRLRDLTSGQRIHYPD